MDISITEIRDQNKYFSKEQKERIRVCMLRIGEVIIKCYANELIIQEYEKYMKTNDSSMLKIKNFINEYKYAFVALGNNNLRMDWINKLETASFTLVNLIHKSAIVSPSVILESGIIIEAGAVINTNSKVLKGVIISIGALIDHNVKIGSGCHIRAGSVIKPNTNISENTVIKENSSI